MWTAQDMQGFGYSVRPLPPSYLRLARYFDALHAALKTGDSSQVRAVQAEYGIRPS
jgi:hypothetical protein